MNNNYKEKLKTFQFDLKIEKMNNFKIINEIIYYTYIRYNNNYYNAININNIILSYYRSEFINNVIIFYLKKKKKKLKKKKKIKNKLWIMKINYYK